MIVIRAHTDKMAALIDCASNRSASVHGVAARLHRANNPATEHPCWDTQSRFKVELACDPKRLSYALIAAAMACRNDIDMRRAWLPFADPQAEKIRWTRPRYHASREDHHERGQ